MLRMMTTPTMMMMLLIRINESKVSVLMIMR